MHSRNSADRAGANRYIKARGQVPATTVTSVRRTIDASGLPLLAFALFSFAVAGTIDTALVPTAAAAVAITTVIVGCYGLARWARSVSRTRHATVAVGCWIALIIVATVHAVVPGSTSTVALSTLQGVTWAALLGAGVSTFYLGCREYGAQTSPDRTEDVLDDASY